jgi:starch phosphorylase
VEIALNEAMPTYVGCLGVLAGDTLRAVADLKVPKVGVSLLHRKGYFQSRIDESDSQREGGVFWKVEEFLEEFSAARDRRD